MSMPSLSVCLSVCFSFRAHICNLVPICKLVGVSKLRFMTASKKAARMAIGYSITCIAYTQCKYRPISVHNSTVCTAYNRCSDNGGLGRPVFDMSAMCN